MQDKSDQNRAPKELIMSKFIIVDWEDGTSDYYKEDDVVVKEGSTVLKQFGTKMFEGKIASFHNTKTSAKQELAERTEAPKDVAVVSEKAGKRERKMTSRMEEFSTVESTKDVTRSSEKPAKKGNKLQTKEKDKPKKKKIKDASVKKAKEKTNKDLSHVADILMSSQMEEDSSNSSPLKSGLQCTEDLSPSPTPLTPVLTEQPEPVTSSSWTPHSSSTWTPQTQPISSSWPQHSASSWTQQPSQSHSSLWTSQPQQHPSSSWTPHQSQWTSFNSQEGGYQSSTLLGEAVAVSMDIDRPQTGQTYPSSCRGCDQLKVTIETLQRQMHELQQTLYSSYNTRLNQVEQLVTQMQNIQGTVATISGQQVQPPTTAEVVPENLYNGFTKAQLEHDLPGRGWKSDAKWLLRRMFSLTELKGHSITGHHGSRKKTGTVRPPIENRDKLRVLYDIIMEKYPGRMITDINLVLADVVKPSAAGMS